MFSRVLLGLPVRKETKETQESLEKLVQWLVMIVAVDCNCCVHLYDVLAIASNVDEFTSV